MPKVYIEDQVFEKKNYSLEALPKGEYENCRFVNCSFANSDLSENIFLECEFDQCDLSLAKLNYTAFRDVIFKSCKMLGLGFQDCNQLLLSVQFEDCQLKLASFYKLKLKATKFINCNLQEVDFTETDLTGATMDNCDLGRAVFEYTNIEKSDLRSSFNYLINPEINKIKKAKFSLSGVIGLLSQFDIEIE
ncbi:pentapeptide repeat-containing protein [Labilibaculum sp.]|uniref:pentapeptide repeat-containing protein n=1 Tax=Labilibaculum sp. TaxID=2060723 RepID=UPI002AA650DA|nr:pentapeptide repeat-containing protein [Labilibaculum sp.]MBN2596530.1 pentapeptide repeat-containing protein [Marinifilaceae bacterium]